MGRKAFAPRGIVPVRLDVAAAEFTQYVSTTVGKGNTTNAKASVINRLVEQLGASREAWTMTTADLANVLTYVCEGASEAENRARLEAGLKPRTGRTTKGSQNAARVALRQFVEFCHDRHYLSETVFLRKREIITSAKDSVAEEKPRLRFPEEEWPRILDVAEGLHPRVRMASALGLYCARRVSEVLRLQYRHLDFTNDTMEFWNLKRGHAILIPMFPEMREEILRWVNWIAPLHGNPQPDWYLVPAKSVPTGPGSGIPWRLDSSLYPVDPTSPASITTLNRDMHRLMGALGVPVGEGNGMHVFRRSAARVVSLKHGMRTAKALLDHKRLQTTEVYAGTDDQFEVLRERMMPGGATEEKLMPEIIPDTSNVVNMFQRRRPA